MAEPFFWGVATSSFQIEGALREGGRAPSTWDVFCDLPGRILNGDRPDIACDHYHRFEEDVALMKELGVNAYRFSIAWPRIIPDGTGAVNPEGVAFYSRLIDCLLSNGIEPFPTLYHWDLPIGCQLAADGWMARETSTYFARYAKACFDAFGDRVHHWITFNESWCSAVLGYGLGVFPPARKDRDAPYRAAHNLLMAHALAAREFRDGGYSGAIGLANNCDWREPLTDSPADRAAAERAVQFFYGWFTDPVVFGEYPEEMRAKLGKRLPEFTAEERELIKGSADFLGLNHYTTLYASAEKPERGNDIGPNGNGGMIEDQDVFLSVDPEWVRNDMQWNIVPWGFRRMLNWIGRRYPGLPIYVTENGCSCVEPDLASAENDTMRSDFLKDYTAAMLAARDEDGVNVRGYFCWTLMDNFEWTSGYSKHFGLIRTSPDDLTRYRKGSFFTYRDLIRAERG